jgi:hypothetical protein
MKTTPASEPEMKCRICDGDAIPRNWGGMECASCHSVIVTKVPTNEELSDFYQSYNDNYVGGGDIGRAEPNPLREEISGACPRSEKRWNAN